MTAALIYLMIGLVFSIAFITIGAPRLDRAVQGSSRMFRVLLIPGSALVWPLLALKWSRS